MADDPRVQAALHHARRVLGADLQEIAGARVSGEIPLSEAVLNRLIAEKLNGAQGPVESAEVQARPDGGLLVRVRLRKPRFVPPIIVALAIERQPAPPASMDLVLRWSLPGMGPLAAMAAPLLAIFKSAPPGIRLDGERAIVDLAAIATDRGYGPLLPFVTGLTLATRDAAVVVAFDVEVRGRRLQPVRA